MKLAESDGYTREADDASARISAVATGVEGVYSVVCAYAEGQNIVIEATDAGKAQIVRPNGVMQEVKVNVGRNTYPMADGGLDGKDLSDHKSVARYLMQRVRQGLLYQREQIGNTECYEQFVREATLAAVDDGWVELIDYLEQFKYAVSGRASAQRNVMFEYQNEAFDSYLDTEKVVKRNIIRNILLSDVKVGEDNQPVIIYP